jgi:chaperonin GroEL
MMLTSEALVGEKPEPEPPPHIGGAHAGAGSMASGMGGMGGMAGVGGMPGMGGF